MLITLPKPKTPENAALVDHIQAEIIRPLCLMAGADSPRWLRHAHAYPSTETEAQREIIARTLNIVLTLETLVNQIKNPHPLRGNWFNSWELAVHCLNGMNRDHPGDWPMNALWNLWDVYTSNAA